MLKPLCCYIIVIKGRFCDVAVSQTTCFINGLLIMANWSRVSLKKFLALWMQLATSNLDFH